MTQKNYANMENQEALRYNQDKLEWHNFPMFLMKPLAEVGHYGAKKYETYNFLKGAKITQYMDSMKRHIDAFEDPCMSDFDGESNLNHLAHAAWNALVAVWVLKNMPEMDDRFKLPDKKAHNDAGMIYDYIKITNPKKI